MASKPVPKKPAKPSPAPSSAKAAPSSAAKVAANAEAEVAKLDQEIVKLINRRAAATIKLIEAAPDRKAIIYDPRNDDDLYAKLESENQGPLPARTIRGVFRHILSAVRNQARVQRVAYLGPAFSFSHMARPRASARERFTTMDSASTGSALTRIDIFTRSPSR